jgi:hypothetical protein
MANQNVNNQNQGDNQKRPAQPGQSQQGNEKQHEKGANKESPSTDKSRQPGPMTNDV